MPNWIAAPAGSESIVELLGRFTERIAVARDDEPRGGRRPSAPLRFALSFPPRRRI
jgi:hypothetical protein